MYKKILAAVNEYTNSEMAARYAISVAKSCRARLTLMSVSPQGASPGALRKEEAALERLSIEAEWHGVVTEKVVVPGEPLESIAGHVREHGIDLVFIATRREEVARRLFVNTLSRKMMLKLPCSVAAVRVVRMERAAPRKILVPLRGGRQFDEERAYFIARLAEGSGSRVTLFHLPEPITKFFHGETHLRPSERDEVIPRDIVEFMDELGRQGIPHEKRTATGSVSRTITSEAAFGRSDLIVMGASQRSLIRSFIKGNPMEEVLRETPCNLIIFRPRHAR